LDGKTDRAAAMAVLTEGAREIFAGDYKNVDRIFPLTDPQKNPPEIAELAEAFGLMAVKVEAREFQLEQKIEELRAKQAALEEANQTRAQLASIFVRVVLLVTVYTFVLGCLTFSSHIKDWAPRVLDVVTLLMVVGMISKHRLPRKSFGLDFSNWKRSALESLAVSAAVIGLLIICKVAANAYWPGTFKETRLIDFGYLDCAFFTYIVVAPLQEFVARGTVQGTLERLFVGRYSRLMAILVTSFLFGSLHVHSSINLALAALLSSCLWGWMYSRQKSLVGVSLSHFLIGNTAALMGYWNFF